MIDETWQRSRLFPVAGSGGEGEQERRGTSALLAVIAAVRECGRTLTPETVSGDETHYGWWFLSHVEQFGIAGAPGPLI